jgi:uncharacterized membrane protein
VGWWSKARCLLDDGGWSDGEQYFGYCYTDIVPLYAHRGLDQGGVPYRDNPIEYPVVTGAQMWLAAQVSQDATSFYHVTALAGAGFWLALVVLLVRAGTPPGRLVWVAAAPTLAAYAFINWDPLPALFLVLAILAHRRGHDVASGVWAGLGVATKLFPGVVIPLVLAARIAQRRWRDGIAHVAAAGGAWLAVNLPVMVVAPRGWLRFFELNRQRGADWDSLWFLGERFVHADLSAHTLNLAIGLLVLAGAVVIGVIGTRRRDPEDWWQLALPILCWFLLVNKVYSPQYSLLLLPLLALALPSPGAFGAFAVADIMVFAIRFPFLGGQEGLAPAPGLGVFAFALLARAMVLAWIIAATTMSTTAAGRAAIPDPDPAARDRCGSHPSAAVGAGRRGRRYRWIL